MKTTGIIACTALAVILTSCAARESKRVETVIPVKTWNVQPSADAGLRTYVGSVEESSGSQLSFSSMGTVAQVFVDEGDAVRQGQVLAELDKSTAQDGYDIARLALNQAQDAFKRLDALYKKGSLPEIQYIEIQTKLAQAQAAEHMARKNLNDCTLRAPYAGYISKRMVDAGNNTAPGLGCFKLVKIDRVKVKVSIPEKEIASVRLGQTVNFTVAALDDRAFSGKVTEKGVQANSISHTYDMKIELPNAGHTLLPGMVCSVKIALGEDRKAVILPQEAVLVDGTQPFVWLAKADQASKQIVTTDGVCDEGVIITAGLSEGDRVIVSGQNKVSEGTKIKAL